MEGIQIIIFIIIIAVAIAQQISKAYKKEKAASPKEVLADMFPPLEVEEKPVSPAPMIHKPKATRKPNQPIAPSKPNISTQTKDKKTTSASIKLNTREEARRAFIYSEIFNRKY